MLVFQTVRIILIFIISFLVALIFTPFIFKFLEKFNLRKRNIRDEKSAPVFYKFHKDKSNTPTMGGIIIWGTTTCLALLFGFLGHLFDGFFEYLNFINRGETYVPLAALFLSAIVGALDDVLGILGIGPKNGGLGMKIKIIFYSLIGILVGAWFYFKLGWSMIHIPFLGNFDIGFWYFLFFVFIIIATSFSANETDGLDGLAGGVFLFSLIFLLIVSIVIGKYDLASLIASLLGSLLAFLWFNIYPAKFFMGDTGSMSLGVFIGVVAMFTKTEFLLPIFGFILVIESLSVIIQVLSKKIRHKKVFLSAPIHHHFQGVGWPESQITMRFWIISAVMTVLALAIFFLSKFA